MNEITTTVNQLSLEYQGAMELHTRIITSGTIAANALVEMCKALKEMRDRRQYVHMGYNSFENYVEEAANIKARQAYTYISTYERLGDSLLQSNAGLGITKLELIAQLPEAKREEIAESASDMTTRELKATVDELTKAREQMSILESQIESQNEINCDLADKLKAVESDKTSLADQLELARRAQPIIVESPAADPEAIRKQVTKELEEKHNDEIDAAKAESFEKGKSLGFSAVQSIEAEKDAAIKRAAELEKQMVAAGGDRETILFAHLFNELQDQFNKLLDCTGRMNQETSDKYRGAITKFISLMNQRLEVAG